MPGLGGPFADAGARVVVAGRRLGPLQALAADTGGLAVASDVSDEGQIAALFAKCEGALGRLFVGRVWYTAATYFGHAVSASVGPFDDWTHVAVELSSEDLPYLLCQLEVEGDGFAWFDDLNWYEVNP